jgi:MFS family permease
VTEQAFSFRRIALPAFGPSLLFGIAEGSVIPVIVLSARDLGASVAAAALVATLMGVGSLVTNFPASTLTARYGERPAIVGAAAWGSAAMLLRVTATSLWVFASGIFMLGMAGSVFNLARQSYLTEAVPLRLRARALSTLGGVMRIGVFIGPFLGAAAIVALGLGGAYWVGLTALIAAGAMALPLPPHLSSPITAGTETTPTLRSIASEHSRVYLTVGFAILLIGAVRASRQIVLPLWAESLGLEASTASIIYGLAGAVDMLIFYPAGKIMDIKGRRVVAVPSMLITGLALALVPVTTGAVPLLAVALLMGFGNGIGSGLVMTLGADFAPSPGRPQFLGIWRFMYDSGAFTGPALLSGMTAALSLAAGIWSTASLGFLAAAFLYRWIPPRTSAKP